MRLYFDEVVFCEVFLIDMLFVHFEISEEDDFSTVSTKNQQLLFIICFDFIPSQLQQNYYSIHNLQNIFINFGGKMFYKINWQEWSSF